MKRSGSEQAPSLYPIPSSASGRRVQTVSLSTRGERPRERMVADRSTVRQGGATPSESFCQTFFVPVLPFCSNKRVSEPFALGWRQYLDGFERISEHHNKFLRYKYRVRYRSHSYATLLRFLQRRMSGCYRRSCGSDTQVRHFFGRYKWHWSVCPFHHRHPAAP